MTSESQGIAEARLFLYTCNKGDVHWDSILNLKGFCRLNCKGFIELFLINRFFIGIIDLIVMLYMK